MDNQMVRGDWFVFWLIIIQPVIDLITSLSNNMNEFAISAGALSRTCIMVFLFIYIFYYFIRKKQKMLWLFALSFVVMLIMMVVNISQKGNFAWFQEINFVLKTSYYLVMIYLAIILIENRILNKALIYRSAKIISLIIGGSYWLAIITNTSMSSYSYDSKGYSGWFYSANELSVIVIILLGLTVINLTYDKKITSWLAFTFMLSMQPMIGTKAAFLGGLFIVTLSVIYLLLRFNLRIWKDKSCLLFFGIVILFICLIPLSPITSNTQQTYTDTKKKQTEEVHVEEEQGSVLMKKLLSSRNVYFQDIKKDFIEANGLRKAFGLGYAGDYNMEEPKLIEMDFLDMFFSYGLIGTLFLLLPLFYLVMRILKVIFPLNMKKTLLIFTLGICFAISFLAGHVVFAPSVMTYVAILFTLLGVEKYEFQTDGEHHRTRV